MLDFCHNPNVMSGGSSQCLLDELARLGEDGVLAELCDVLKRSGCNWLEEEVPTGCINREQFARQTETETQANVSVCGHMDATPGMHRVQERRDCRGSRTRESSLHGLWYDPSYPINGECFHEHDIRTTKEWSVHKDPLLLSCSIFPITLDGYASIDKSTDIRRGAARFASCLRWHKQSRRRRRCQANKKDWDGIKAPSS